MHSLQRLDSDIIKTLKEIISNKNENLWLRMAPLDRYLQVNPSLDEDLDLLLVDEPQLLRKIVPFLITKQYKLDIVKEKVVNCITHGEDMTSYRITNCVSLISLGKWLSKFQL